MTDPSTHDAEFRVHARRFAAGQEMPPHADATSRLSIVLCGQLSERVGRREEHAGAGSLVMKPGHVVHRNRFGPTGARTLSIELPTALLTDAAAATMDRWRWFHAGALSIATLRLCLAARAPSRDDGALADRVIDVLAAIDDTGHTLDRRAPPAWLARVRERIHDRDPQAGSVSALAASAGVHPVYLARCFRRHFGGSVVDDIQASRLRAAVAMMATGTQSLAHIADASGYADQSHLSRACRRSLGLSPSRCRHLLD